MPDLRDQIRMYYEATALPVDVDDLLVEPGTVLVGPFPDVTRRRSALKTHYPDISTPAPPQGPRRPWWRGPVAAAAAFAVTAIVVAVVALVAGGGDDTSPVATTVPPTTVAPPVTTVAPVPTTIPPVVLPAKTSASDAAEAWGLAFFAGDGDRVIELSHAEYDDFGPLDDPATLALIRDAAGYYGTLGTDATVSCVQVDEGREPDAVTCEGTLTNTLYEAAGIDPVSNTTHWRMRDDKLAGAVAPVEGDVVVPPTNPLVDRSFQRWAENAYPADYIEACPNRANFPSGTACAQFQLDHLDEWVVVWNEEQ